MTSNNGDGDTVMCKNITKTKELLKEFSGFINAITWSYFNITGVDRAELFGEANVALLKACDDFNALRGGSFTAYAKFIIVDALNEYIRVNKISVSIPRYISRANLIINRLKKALNNEEDLFSAVINGDTPVEELEDKVVDELILLQSAAKRAGTSVVELVSRSEFLPSNNVDPIVIEEVITDDCKEKEILTKLLVKQIQSFLTEDELLISNLLMEGENANSISTKLNKSYKWVKNRIKSIRIKAVKYLDIDI